MLKCASFADRLYDEDCREALLGRGPVPSEVDAHRRSCPACSASWTEAADDLAVLPLLLAAEAPVDLVRRIRLVTARALSPIDWSSGISWAAIGASTAFWVGIHAPTWLGLGPLALFAAGASLAFTASTLRAVLREGWRG
jgi:hypothetical protein